MRIHELRAQGKGIREIARMTGRARNTVRRYLRNRPRRAAKRVSKPSRLDPFKSLLRVRISEGVLNCTVLLRELRAHGYTGGKTLTKDYVRPYRLARPPRATVPFEVQPGQ